VKKICRNCLFRIAFYGVLALGVSFAAVVQAAPDISAVTFGVTIERGDVRTARNWLDDGLPPEFVGDRVGTGLMIAAWEGNVPMMEVFYQHGARLDAVNSNGEQALQLAAFKGNMEAVKWLLDHGASVNRAGNQWSALQYAAFNGYRDLVQYLISRGADVNARAPNEATALMLTAREGRADIAEDLIKAGADPRLTNDLGETALVWAMRHDNLDVARVVSSPEAFANAVRAQPATPQVAMRSIPASSQVEDLLRRIRQSEANNLPTAGLRRQLAVAVERMHNDKQREATDAAAKDAGAVKGIVITAQRQGGGEKAEVVYGNSTSAASTATPGASPAGSAQTNASPASTSVPTPATQKQPDNISILLARIRAAKAKGQPTDALRKQLMDAVTTYR